MIKREIVFSYDEDLFLEFAPKFKIHKCPPEFPHPQMMHAHHPYFLDFEVPETEAETGLGDYSYELGKPPKFDDLYKMPIPEYISQSDLNREIFEEIVHLVNALTCHRIFQYDHRSAWTVAHGGGEYSLRYSQDNYLAPDFETPTEITSQEDYFGETLFSLRSDDGAMLKQVTFQDLLSTYFAFSDDSFKQAFLNACLVVDKAKKLGDFEQSASYMFLVTAIETLVDLENKGKKNTRCASCGQLQHRVGGKFRDFLGKYGWEIEKKRKDDFYNMRSKISHVGQLLQSSYRHSFHPKSQEDIDKRHKRTVESIKYQTFQGLVETCFATFLYLNMQVNDSE